MDSLLLVRVARHWKAWAVLGALLVASGCSSATRAGSASTLPSGPYLSVSLDVGSKSSAVINKSLIGVNGPGPVQAERAMKAIGVHWVRTDVSFEGSFDGKPVYDCRTGAWNPALLDQRVAGIRAEGGVPLVIVDYSPPCLTVSPSSADATRLPPDQGADRARWDRLVQEMAVHEVAQEKVRYFEVWNEPDWIFFSGGLSGYLQLYGDTARALEAAAARERVHIDVGGPALADVVDQQNTTWLDALLGYVSKNNLPLDFISWHSYVNDPYSGPMQPGGFTICWGHHNGPGANLCYYNPKLDEQTIAHEVTQTRAALKAYPSLHPLLIVDEWNIDGEGDPRMNQPYDAAYAASVLESAQADGLSGMCFFNVSNSATNPDQNWGLLTATFKPKPVYETFLFWHDMGPSQIGAKISASTKSPPNTDAHGRVGAVASRFDSGKITVLLYDFKAYDASGQYGARSPAPYGRTIALKLSGLSTGTYHVQREVVDGEHPTGDLVESSSVSSNQGRALVDLSLPGESVEMVSITPEK